ncbi:MAG: lipid-A-disaccharide synthase [Vicinamibacteria bacterium]|nr:lipid-A-disaccharide synthase [Vicinamibacteria bacterium]
MPARVLISSGEPSGDLYAAELLRHLKERVPGTTAFGLGGDHLAEQGASLVAHVRDLAVIGLVEVVKHLPRLRRIFAEVLARADRERPDVAVLVDYPDFNLRLARELAKRGIPVVYYISPQVWAWRPGRLKQIRRDVAHMLVIFPFEEAVYHQAQVPVTFVGHPLVELLRRDEDRAGFLRTHRLDPARPLVGLLPGSRKQEVAHNLPPIVDAVGQLLRSGRDAQFLLALAPALDAAPIEHAFRELPVRMVRGGAHAILSACDAAVVASGTATVEAALLDAPTVVVYRLSALSYLLGRPFVKVSRFAMPNLVAGRDVLPELIQDGFTGETVATEVARLLDDPSARARMRTGLAEVRTRLGGPGASRRAAEAVARLLPPAALI